MTRADDLGQAVPDAELGEQRLYSRMQGLAGTVTTGRFALAEHHAETARCAGNRAGTTRGPGADDNYVGIVRSIAHGPFSRWIKTVLSET